MPPRHEGLLEKGLKEDHKDDHEPQTRHSAVLKSAKYFLHIARPSFLSKTCARSTKLRRTAYLDGLRGFAALLVYWQHHELWAHELPTPGQIMENAFGYDRQYYMACLPVIRNLFTGGHFAVCTFFVMSGYVLSTKPLSLIHVQDDVKLGDNIASALFRRWLRLYIPVLTTTFILLSLWHLFGIQANFPPQSTFRDEIWKWYAEFKNFSFVFRTGGEPWFSYNFHAWSIPVEFRGSIAIYTTLTALSRCTQTARLLCEIGLIYYFLYIADGAFFAMFISGMLLCDLDLLAVSRNLPKWFYKVESQKQAIFYTLFAVSMYLGGAPSWSADMQVLRESPGWYYLSYLKPQAVWDYKHFYLFWAATFLVAAIPRINWLKPFFESSFNQYMGRISFSFYLDKETVL